MPLVKVPHSPAPPPAVPLTPMLDTGHYGVPGSWTGPDFLSAPPTFLYFARRPLCTTDLATFGPIDQPRLLDDYFYSALVKDLNCLFLFFFLGVQQGPQVETSGKILAFYFCPESW